MTAPMYPVRLLSPTRRRIATVALGSPTSKQLQALGWTPYHGPATVYEAFDGKGQMANLDPGKDPRNGFIVPGSDPGLTPITRPAGSVDFNPSALLL